MAYTYADIYVYFGSFKYVLLVPSSTALINSFIIKWLCLWYVHHKTPLSAAQHNSNQLLALEIKWVSFCLNLFAQFTDFSNVHGTCLVDYPFFFSDWPSKKSELLYHKLELGTLQNRSLIKLHFFRFLLHK